MKGKHQESFREYLLCINLALSHDTIEVARNFLARTQVWTDGA